SGDPYIQHPVAVATVLAELGLDDITLSAALLHDSVEDTGVTLEEVAAEFGDDVAAIVDGVTKLDRVRFDSKEAQQAATMRKMLVAMAKDIRVLLIKLADRLHNMRTIAALSEDKQHRIAKETIDVYAPLAHRLGIAEMKWQLEDLAFATLDPVTRARRLPGPGPRGGAPAARGAPDPGRGHGPAQALLEHLREDGREGPRVRRHLRSGGHPGPRRQCQGLLRGAGLAARHLEACAGPVQGLHRHAQVQPLPVPAHHRHR